MSPGWIAGAVYAAASVVTFVLFGVDKRAAQRGAPRIAESTLHGFEFFGGWPGAWLGMALLRHKSSKTAYRAVWLAIALIHVAAWGAWAALRWTKIP